MRRLTRILIWSFGTVLLVTLLLFGAHLLPQARLGVEPRRAETSAGIEVPARQAQELAQMARVLPWRSELWEQAGQLALESGDAASAIGYFTQADQQGRLSPAGHLALGDSYQQSGNLLAAIEAWQVALEQGAPAAEVYPRLLAAHRHLRDYPAAIAVLQSMLAEEPIRADLHYQIGLMLAATKPEAALPHLKQAGELDAHLAQSASALAQSIRVASMQNDPAYTLVESGRALGALGEWELALYALEAAVQARPDYAEAWAFLGEARQHLPQQAAGGDGLVELEQALALDPNSLSAHLFLALYWQRQGDVSRALSILREAAALFPDNPALPAEIGRMLALQGDLEEAALSYQRAIELAPSDPLYYRLLVQFCLEYNYQMSQIGLPAARRLILLAPNDPAAFDTLGQALYQSGDISNAKRQYHRAISVDAQYAPAYLHLGLVYIQEGKQEKAREMFRLALSLAPGTSTAEHAQRLLQLYTP